MLRREGSEESNNLPERRRGEMLHMRVQWARVVCGRFYIVSVCTSTTSDTQKNSVKLIFVLKLISDCNNKVFLNPHFVNLKKKSLRHTDSTQFEEWNLLGIFFQRSAWWIKTVPSNTRVNYSTAIPRQRHFK